jgi:Leucine-rich repeat (LRR) protein
MRQFFLLIGIFMSLVFASKAQTATSWESAKEQGSSLKKIKITHEHLHELPDIFYQFPNLEEVDFSNNRIQHLPPSFYTCKKLKVINLFNNLCLLYTSDAADDPHRV